jgi:hypothetical protein
MRNSLRGVGGLPKVWVLEHSFKEIPTKSETTQVHVLIHCKPAEVYSSQIWRMYYLAVPDSP